MDFEELEKRIEENSKKLDVLAEQIQNNFNNINNNSDRIEKNSGALALLHTINSNSHKYFTIWIITFVALLASFGCIIYLLMR